MKKYRLLLIICWLSWNYTLYSQRSNYIVENSNFSNLSPSNSIYSISQDSIGYLWLSTKNGLCQFDGSTPTYFLPSKNRENPTSDDFINCTLPNVNSKIWVGTNSNGLLSFDPQTEEFSRLFQGTKTSEKLIGNSIYDIIKNKKGEIWILTDKGLNCVDNKTILKQYNIPSSIGRKAASKRRKKMAFDAKGNLWFIYKGVLLEHNPISSKITRINVGINNCSALECIASGSNNEMYVGSQKNGLITMNTISKKTMNIKWANYISSSDRLNHIISIHEDKLGTVWLGTGEIMIPINSSKLKWESVKPLTLPEYQFHIGNISSSIFEDQSGVIWSVANFNGLKKITIPTKFFSQYSATDEKGQASKNIKVNSFFQDKKGLIWLGTRKGMTAFDPTTKKIIPLSLSATDWVNLNEVSSFYDTKDESFLIGTWNRISAFSSLSLKTNKFRHYNLLNEKANTVGEITTLGSTLYIGTFGGGVRCLNKEDLKKGDLSKQQSIPYFKNKDIYRLLLDRNQQLWVSIYDEGLGLYDARTKKTLIFKHTKDSTSLSDNMVHAIYQDHKGRIWLGTDNGLNIYQPQQKKFKTYYCEKSSDKNAIISITEDKYANIWFSQRNRIGKFNPSNELFTYYSPEKEMPNCGFNAASAFTDKAGTVYFGTLNYGFITIQPERINNSKPSTVVLSSLYINNEKANISELERQDNIALQHINNAKKITLSYAQNNFGLEFAILSYLSTSENQYAYKLEGLHKDWVYSNGENNIARYSNLAPGKYVFKVKAANYLGVWSEQPKSLTIEILPPPWKTWWAYMLYFLIVASIVTLVIYYSFKQLKLSQTVKFERLEKENIHLLNNQRLQFFTNVSHEFRTPLTLISAYNKKIKEHIDTSDYIYPWVHNSQQNTDQLLLLVNQLLDFRKLEQNQTQLLVAQSDIVAFCQGIFSQFEPLAKLKNIDFKFNSDLASAKVWFDSIKLEHILFNLLSNAFKFSTEGESVVFELSIENYHTPNCKVTIEIQDTGIGISLEDKDKIFEDFYQAKATSDAEHPGAGIGLSFVRQLAAVHRGNISVDSELGKGSVFALELYVDKNFYSENEWAEVSPNDAISLPVLESKNIQPMNSTAQKVFKILIVEDNDELRTLIAKDILNDYETLEATNGRDGLKMAILHNPDMILSDVQMPEMNGFELCKELKNDIQCSHIPVILLTAKVLNENKLEGYQSGADDYIEKPFSGDLLQLKINNMLETRQQWQMHFGTKPTQLPTANTTFSDTDNAFLKQSNELIEQHIAEIQFDVEDFCKEMGLSQGLIYRKIKALTGLSISEYIRLERLNKAASLIKENKYTVQEICFMVGFATPSYFTKCFKKQFGTLPKEFKFEN